MRSLRAPLLALLALAFVAQAAQADPVTAVTLNQFGPSWVCVEAGASTSVAFTLVNRRTGRTVATDTVSTPTSANCAGGGGTSFRTDFGRGYLFGGRVVATPSGSPSLAVDVPYGSGDTADNGATSVIRIAGLPPTSMVKLNGLSAVPVTGSRVTSAPIAGYGANVQVTATVSGAALTVFFTTAQSNFSARSSVVDVSGTDPLGAPVHVSVVSAGRSAAFTMTPSASGIRANLPFDVLSGALVSVSQAGWFSHTGRAGTVVMRNDGFLVSIPTGTTGNYGFNATLFDDNATFPPTSPLGCQTLGPSSFVTTACGVPYPDRYSANITGLVMASGDEASVDETTPTRDRLDSTATHLGFSGDDNGFIAGTLQPTVNAPLRVVAVRPAGGGYTAAVFRSRARAFDGRVFVEGEGDAPLTLRITRGTTFTISGPSLPRARRYVFNVSAAFLGTTVTGRAAPHARLRISQQTGNANLLRFITADAAGRYALALVDPQPGDDVGVEAVDLATRDVSGTSLTFGAPAVRITGVRDQQLVRGTIRVGVRAPAARQVLLDGGEITGQRRSSPPFAFAVNTRPAGDGPAEITAQAFGAGGLDGFDFLWVIVDNTAPRGALPAETFARSGRRLRLHPGAGDANGIASALVTWGDGTRQRLRGRRATAALSHVYHRSGNFRVRVTITDRAGNRRVVRTLVRVG
jgi:hypothetical protein